VAERKVTDEEQDFIFDLVPTDAVIWGDLEEMEHFKHATYAWWRTEVLGHPKAHPGCCKTCGCATTCMLGAFYEGVVTMVINELSKIGVIRGLGRTDCPRVDAEDKHHQHSYIHTDPAIGPTICDGWSPDE